MFQPWLWIYVLFSGNYTAFKRIQEARQRVILLLILQPTNLYLGIWAITNILLVIKSGFNVEALQRFDSEVGRNVAPLPFHLFAIHLCTVLSDQRSWTLFVSIAAFFLFFLQSVHFCLWLGTNGNPTVFDILQSGINTTICAREHHGQVPACPCLSCSADFPPCVQMLHVTGLDCPTFSRLLGFWKIHVLLCQPILLSLR